MINLKNNKKMKIIAGIGLLIIGIIGLFLPILQGIALITAGSGLIFGKKIFKKLKVNIDKLLNRKKG